MSQQGNRESEERDVQEQPSEQELFGESLSRHSTDVPDRTGSVASQFVNTGVPAQTPIG